MFIFIVIGFIIAALVIPPLAPFFNPYFLGITIIRLFKDMGRKVEKSLEDEDKRRR